MDQVIVVHFLGVDDVTVLFLAQVGWIDAIRSQEFSVGHAKGLTDGLCDELRLWEGECFWGKLLRRKDFPVGNKEDHKMQLISETKWKYVLKIKCVCVQFTLTSSDSKT